MENNAKMIGLEQEEEIELDLGLSIGCSFKNPEKPNLINNEAVQSQHRIDPWTSSFEVDPQVKREIEALRRQEAKRKRQEKQHKKINGDNKLPDLDTKRCEFDVKEGECKRSREEGNNKTEMQNLNLNFTVEQNINLNKPSAFSCNQKGNSSTLCPYPALHYVPFTNGLQHPCLPCLAGGGGAGGLLDEPGLHAVNVCVNSDENRRSGSNVSPVCSSSVVSDYRSSSYEGGGSSDARSHSSHSLLEQNPLHGSRANDTNDQFEHSASSHSRETAQVYDKTTNCPGNCIKQKIPSDTAQFIPITNCTTNTVDQQTIPSNIVQFRPTKPKEDQQPVSSESQVSTSVNPSLKESKRDTGKPPKPQSQNQIIHCLQQMPCVSTTGNGPNGKTINGFLYRYTKTELSIICVCHGTSFSPAEFVQHAGGTEVSHPLRHITVIPSTF